MDADSTVYIYQEINKAKICSHLVEFLSPVNLLYQFVCKSA
jgi:hypothetical protein